MRMQVRCQLGLQSSQSCLWLKDILPGSLMWSLAGHSSPLTMSRRAQYLIPTGLSLGCLSILLIWQLAFSTATDLNWGVGEKKVGRGGGNDGGSVDKPMMEAVAFKNLVLEVTYHCFCSAALVTKTNPNTAWGRMTRVWHPLGSDLCGPSWKLDASGGYLKTGDRDRRLFSILLLFHF